MNATQAQLYQRLQSFTLDDPSHEFGFTRHLMKSNGWTEAYTQRAIAEYKKFVFLTVEATHQVVPSDQVDQVWHAHILLTQSYWDEFCPKVLGRKLHHHPARGGEEEREHFHNLYHQTIESYRYFFGEPPTDIWSPADIRFGNELKMQRLNLSNYWVFPKQWPKWSFPKWFSIPGAIFLLTCGGVTQVQGKTSTPQFNSITAFQDFAIICSYVGLWVLAYLYFDIIRRPPRQRHSPTLNLDETAYLAGQRNRVMELAIARLVDHGYLLPNVEHRTFSILKAIDPQAPKLDQEIMRLVPHMPDWERLRTTHRIDNTYMRHLRSSLEKEKLFVPTALDYLEKILFVSVFVITLCLPSSLSQSFPFALKFIFLPLHCIVFVLFVAFLGCSLNFSGLTYWGIAALARIYKDHDAYNPMERVAIYGIGALSGGKLDDLKQLFQAQKKKDDNNDGSVCGCGC